MTEESNSSVEVETDASYLSFLPGERLQKARELRGLSTAQVAQELRLSERYVLAMEADDYGSLPEPAFVRGYMRRYAQLVKLSPDDIVARFDESLGGSQMVELEHRKRRNPLQLLGDLSRRRVNWARIMGWISAGLIMLVVLGTIFWRVGTSRPAVAPVTDTAVPAVVPAPAAPSAMAPMAGSGAVAVGSAPADTLPNPATSSVSTVLPTAAAPAGSGVVPQPALAAADTVSLSFSGVSWVSVKDAAGKTLYEGTEQAGESLSLTGVAPLTVSLGNAPQTVLAFNGKVVDLRPSTQGKTATLTLRR